MVFLIQNTQNRDARAIHLKLDELIRANDGARNLMIDLEELADEDLDKLHIELCDLKKSAEVKIEKVLKSKKRNRRN